MLALSWLVYFITFSVLVSKEASSQSKQKSAQRILNYINKSAAKFRMPPAKSVKLYWETQRIQLSRGFLPYLHSIA